MIRNEISQHSSILERDLDVVVYGKAGYPVVAFSTMSAPCTDFEDYGMIDALADLIDSEQIQLFCLSNVDDISWAADHHDMEWRIAMQEAYFNYLCDEALPLVHATNGSELRPLAIGVDVGATQAAILALRRPDLFQGCVALSGVYDASALMDDYMSDLVYDNSPVRFLTNMPADHPYVELYNERTLVFCCGKGHWEDDSVRTQGIIDDAFRVLGVNATCDYWGYDVNHDWYWWQKEMTYHLPAALESVKAELAAEAKAAEEPEVKAEVAEEPVKRAEESVKVAEPVAEAAAAAAATEAAAEPAAEAAPKTTTRRRSTSSSSKSTSSTGTASKSTSTRRSSTSKSTATKSTTAAKAATTEPAAEVAAEPAATEAAPKTTTRKRSTSSTSKSTSSTGTASKSTSTRRSSTSKTAAAKAAAAAETTPTPTAEATATAEAEATTTAPKSTSTRRSTSSTSKSTSSSSTRKSTSTRSSGTSTRKRSTTSTSAAAKAAAETPAAETPATEEKPAETTDTTPEASETK